MLYSNFLNFVFVTDGVRVFYNYTRISLMDGQDA